MKRAELTPLSRVYSLPLHWRAAKKKGGPPSLLQSPLERLLSGFLARLAAKKGNRREAEKTDLLFAPPVPHVLPRRKRKRRPERKNVFGGVCSFCKYFAHFLAVYFCSFLFPSYFFPTRSRLAVTKNSPKAGKSAAKLGQVF